MRSLTVRSFAAQASTAARSSPRRSCRNSTFPALVTSVSSSYSSSTPSSGGPVLYLRRNYATQHQTSSSSSSSSSAASRRRAVTPFNDDGGVPWTDLSAGEKTARAAQQTFNFGMVVVGVVLTGGVGYFLYTEVFSPSSKVANFNRAVDRIKADHRCTDVLGPGKTITAFGEETWNKWRRARPIASSTRTDAQGEHFLMHFHVEGSRARGTAYLHMVRPPGGSAFAYRYFYVEVPGHERIYLENAQAGDAAGGDKKRTLFGIKWA